jgi:hypothetical protein
MKVPNMKLKVLGIAVTALLGTVLATASVAQPRGRGGFDGPPPRGEMRGPQAGARGASPERFIERHDTNADGRVSEAEFVDERLQNVDEQFERRDTNGDGVIAADEQAPRGRPGRPGRGPRADRERPEPPAIDRDAITACVRETIAGYEPRFDDERDDVFANVDTNGDAKLSLTEVSAALEARAHERFEHIDSNGDGYVTEAEVEAQSAAQLAARRAMRDCIREQVQG